MVTVLYMGVFIGVFYFFLIRPQQKKTKELADLRSKISLGDDVVTIGGICGRVVQVNEDEVVIETGENNGTSIRLKKWAVGSVVVKDMR